MKSIQGIMLGATLALAGCQIAGPDESPDFDRAFLRTDDTSYVATYLRGEGPYQEYGFTLVARYENRSGAPVYLSRCYPGDPHPIYGVDLVAPDEEWRAAYGGVWACVGHNHPIVVPPGTVRLDTLTLSGPNAWQGGEPLGVLEGRFRLIYEAQSCREEARCPLPEAQQYSNVFEVRVEE